LASSTRSFMFLTPHRSLWLLRYSAAICHASCIVLASPAAPCLAQCADQVNGPGGCSYIWDDFDIPFNGATDCEPHTFGLIDKYFQREWDKHTFALITHRCHVFRCYRFCHNYHNPIRCISKRHMCSALLVQSESGTGLSCSFLTNRQGIGTEQMTQMSLLMSRARCSCMGLSSVSNFLAIE